MTESPNNASNPCSIDLADIDHCKSSMYRAMVARTASSEWRGAARSKLAAGVEKGSLEDVSLLSPVNENQYCAEHEDVELEEDAMANAREDLGAVTIAIDEAPGESTTPTETQQQHEAHGDRGQDLEQPADTLESVFECGNEVSPEEETGQATKEEEEPEIPVKYLNWEPKPEDDEETVMEDVELGGESELEDHIAEVEIDQEAFERIRQMEKERMEEQRKLRRLCATCGVLFMLLLTSWLIVALANASKSNDEKQHKTPLKEENPSSQSTTRYTGSIYPLQEPKISNDLNDRITVKFPVNMLVPEGSSVLHKVYDGPDCSASTGGAQDITGQDGYVHAGLYSAGAIQRTNNPADQMGLYLQWEAEHVKESPLYADWQEDTLGSPHISSTSDDYATMDLCVELSILDSEGLLAHYTETYILTTWAHDLLEKVSTVSVTIDSS